MVYDLSRYDKFRIKDFLGYSQFLCLFIHNSFKSQKIDVTFIKPVEHMKLC